jgi:hypothetical protein
MPPGTLVFLAVLLLAGCKKDRGTANANLPTTPDQTAKLLVGAWIEDSVDLAYSTSIPCVQPSYLVVNSDLTYSMLQTTIYNNAANPSIDDDTGKFVDIGTRYITASSSGGRHYLGEYGKLQINLLNGHTLVLFSIANVATPPSWFFHK